MRRLPKDQRGAVLAEFIIAFVPLLAMFFCFTQYAQAATANLVLRHAATAGVRAAIVTYGSCSKADEACASFNPGGNIGDGETPDQLIRNATLLTMGSWVGSFQNVQIDYKTGTKASASDPHGIVRVTVTADYACETPMARSIMCRGGVVRMKEFAELPMQGASYKAPGQDNAW